MMQKRYSRLAAVMLSLVVVSRATASEIPLSCSNARTAEIQCVESCDVLQRDFTPVELEVSQTTLEICAYSACFAGEVKSHLIVGEHAVWSAIVTRENEVGPDQGERLTVMLDRSRSLAVMLWGSFAQPLSCGPAQAIAR